MSKIQKLEAMAGIPYRLRYAGATIGGDLGQTLMDAALRIEAAEAERDALREQIKQAFLEGIEYAEGADFPDPGIAWARSRARKALETRK